ncbi:MAG: hypothetical protein V3R73_01555 [Sphingomonadales bacterium]
MNNSTTRIMRGGAWLAVAALAATAFSATSAVARNQWSNYHWEKPAGQTHLTINVNNCQTDPSHATRKYGYNTFDHFSGPNDDWDDIIAGGGGAIVLVDGACPNFSGLAPTAGDPLGNFNSRSQIAAFGYDATDTNAEGTINAFNDSYGNNGWVGLAIISLEQSSGDNHIVYGEVYLNDYYATQFNVYNRALVMRKVQCQEIGHIFGLDHVKKDNSCMYSSAAFVGSTYTPNGHDGGMVNKITDSHGGTVEPPPPDDGGGPCAKKKPPPKCGAAGVFRGKANWAEGFASRGEMYESADLVVSVTVRSGSMFDRMVGTAGRALPVSQAVMLIRETIKGKAKGVIRVEHVRGLGLEIEDDPGYVNGDNYLLYLRQIGVSTFRVVNPQGRIPQ